MTPRIDKAGQALFDEDGNIAERRYEREKALLAAHFPKALLSNYMPKEGGRVFEQVNKEVVGSYSERRPIRQPWEMTISRRESSKSSGNGTDSGSYS